MAKPESRIQTLAGRHLKGVLDSDFGLLSDFAPRVSDFYLTDHRRLKNMLVSNRPAKKTFQQSQIPASMSVSMKLLVIGSGGREHALVWKLAQSPHVSQLWCAPGNAGIAGERLAKRQAPVECVGINAEDLPRLLVFARENKPGLTVVGPDSPLGLGIVDLFQKNGLRIWGPNQKAAQFQCSKVFSQDFMKRHGIPTARAGTFTDATADRKFAAELDDCCAVKADGLAFGKGVLICHTAAETHQAIDEMLVNRSFGAAGSRIVIQELLEGTEISL